MNFEKEYLDSLKECLKQYESTAQEIDQILNKYGRNFEFKIENENESHSSDLGENIKDDELDERMISNNNQEQNQIPNHSSHFKNEPSSFNPNRSLLVCDKINILKQSFEVDFGHQFPEEFKNDKQNIRLKYQQFLDQLIFNERQNQSQKIEFRPHQVDSQKNDQEVIIQELLDKLSSIRQSLKVHQESCSKRIQILELKSID